MRRQFRVFQCATCEKTVVRRNALQKYCSACSQQKSAIRHQNGSNSVKYGRARKRNEFGAQKSTEGRHSLISAPIRMEGAHSEVFLKFPFSWSASKNHIYSMRRGSHHVFLREESKKYRDALISRLQVSLRDNPFFHNKVWISLYIEKPNHKGDAINFIDFLCDAIKRALGIDDRWFCINKVDWMVVKKDPNIFISIAQDCQGDAQVCGYCGSILPLDQFTSNKSNKFGISRICRICSQSEGADKRHRKRQTKADHDLFCDLT